MKLTLDELRTKLYMSNDPKEREIGELLEFALSSSCGESRYLYNLGYADGYSAAGGTT